MAKKEVLLELAAFMDSPRRRPLENPPKESSAPSWASSSPPCLEDFGHPAPSTGRARHARGAGAPVALALFQGDALRSLRPMCCALTWTLSKTNTSWPIGLKCAAGFESTVDEFLQTVRTGKNVHGHHHHQHVEPQKPVQHGAPKLVATILAPAEVARSTKSATAVRPWHAARGSLGRSRSLVPRTVARAGRGFSRRAQACAAWGRSPRGSSPLACFAGSSPGAFPGR